MQSQNTTNLRGLNKVRARHKSNKRTKIIVKKKKKGGINKEKVKITKKKIRTEKKVITVTSEATFRILNLWTTKNEETWVCECAKEATLIKTSYFGQ